MTWTTGNLLRLNTILLISFIYFFWHCNSMTWALKCLQSPECFSVDSRKKAWMLVSGLQAGCLCGRMILECDQCGLLLFVLLCVLEGRICGGPSSLLISFGLLPPWLPLFPPALCSLPSVHPSMNSEPLWESLLLQRRPM